MEALLDKFPVLFVIVITYITALIFFAFNNIKIIKFGGKIIKTLGQIIEKKHGMLTTKIKIHIIKPIGRPRERAIGIETIKNIQCVNLSWGEVPLILTSNEARKLNSMINEALKNNE